MTDKDGKKIKLGSVVALRKMGRDSYTQKGKVIEVGDTFIRMIDHRTGSIHYAEMAQIKRMSYNPPKKQRWEDL